MNQFKMLRLLRLLKSGPRQLTASRHKTTHIPFDTKPFPFQRFEACCPEGDTFNNGYVACSKHPMPKVIGKKVELHTEFGPSISGRQLVACVGQDAPDWTRAKVESVRNGMVYALNSAQNTWMKQTDRSEIVQGGRLLTTVCDRPSSTEWPTSDLLLFPEFRRYPAVHPDKLLDSPMGKVLDALWKNPTTPKLPSIPEEQALEDVDTVVLVCTHTMRDKRCGILGPLIVEEFQKVLSQQGLLKGQDNGRVEVWGVSHFGGHKFAGNLIIHQKGLGGHMYGNVRQCHVPSIIDRHIINHKVIKELWRGEVTPPSIE